VEATPESVEKNKKNPGVWRRLPGSVEVTYFCLKIFFRYVRG
jgi:hypothetical protein